MRVDPGHLLYAGTPDAILIVQPDGTFVHVNPAAERLFGYPEAELTGRNLIDLGGAGRVWAEPEVARFWEMGRWRGVFDLRRRDGAAILIEADAVRLAGPDGDLIGLVCRVARAEPETFFGASAAHARLQALLANASELITIVSRSGVITYESPSLLPLLGYQPTGLIGLSAFDFVHPDDQDRVWAAFVRLLNDPTRREWTEFRFRHRDGSWRWLEAVGSNLLDDPLIAGLVVNSRDVTARKETDSALRASDERFRLLVEQLPAAVYIVANDREWSPVYISPRMTDLAGPGARADFLAGRWHERIHPDDRARVDAENARVADGRASFSLEYRVRTDAGDYFWLRDESQLVRDERGEVVAWQGLHIDITGQHEMQRALEAARDAAEESSRLKSAFLSTMSHELRTPMNAIIGYSHMLLEEMEGPLNRRQADAVQHITRGADRLLGLINDVLDLSRVESGSLELSRDEVDVARLVESVRDELAPLARSKDLRIEIERGADLPRFAGDEARIRQIVLNLVGNAVKFTERGTVRIAPRFAHGRVAIAVVDTGIGIAPEILPYVFDEFRQADASTTRKYGGSGLGLAIAQRLAELHGGRIGVASRLGEGSTFTLELPVDVDVDDARGGSARIGPNAVAAVDIDVDADADADAAG